MDFFAQIGKNAENIRFLEMGRNGLRIRSLDTQMRQLVNVKALQSLIIHEGVNAVYPFLREHLIKGIKAFLLRGKGAKERRRRFDLLRLNLKGSGSQGIDVQKEWAQIEATLIKEGIL
jgi:Holliday junction resolvase-like predicted endonuclease